MKRLLSIALAVGMLAILAAPVAAAKPGAGGYLPPELDNVTGTVTGETTGTFAGDVTLSRVQAVGGELIASGTVTGLVNGDATTTAFSAPVTITQATCDILELTLGPLDLDLLGLVIHLDQVHLTIDAEQGPGNLLGNLLCAVAGILDGPDPIGNLLNQIAGLLNQILSILG